MLSSPLHYAIPDVSDRDAAPDGDQDPPAGDPYVDDDADVTHEPLVFRL